ncbi:hypothetical protein [Priestia megaterium]|uniref:hypothetical protein n=1 Tax=Priestia megaterium TaxID=1404 RepID=UPI001596D77A|nr:hypothetical protein [Priestia megaterium]
MISKKPTEIEIDQKKLNQMKLNILRAEQNNLKTREKTNEEMIETIRKIIEDEVRKNY